MALLCHEETEEFKEEYTIRAGGESVNAEIKTTHGLAKVWTRGEPKVPESQMEPTHRILPI
jgi:hypothetical protein